MHTVIETETRRWVVVCPQGHIVWGSATQSHALYWASVYAQVPSTQCRLQRCAH